jgi:hypothetical protein
MGTGIVGAMLRLACPLLFIVLYDIGESKERSSQGFVLRGKPF